MVNYTSGGQLPVQGEHLLDQDDHPVMPFPVRRVGEVDGADGKLNKKLFIGCKISPVEGGEGGKFVRRIAQVYGGPLRFHKEFSRPADPESIARRLHHSADPDGVLMEHVFVGLWRDRPHCPGPILRP